MKRLLPAILLLAPLAELHSAETKPARPNVLLVILDDWGPNLSCYGDKEISTPNLDKLASEGSLYRNCFSMAPVCSVGRSTLTTGISQYAIHSEHHRVAEADKQELPPGIKSLPEIFREAGYFTVLGACALPGADKLDLNFKFPKDEIYLGKDWNERKSGQPFFAQTTLMSMHRVWHHAPGHPIDPAKVSLPAWYPDTPLTRADWAMGLESAQIDDRDFGQMIARLKSEGLYDNTIIVVTSDNGIALPRAKQFLYDGGLHVPLLIRWPASIRPGTVESRLVSHIDIAPTILALAGLPVPSGMQGQDILNPATPPRRYIFAARDRLDQTHDAMRAVRSQDFKYILNLMPERAYAQYSRYKESEYPGIALMNVLHLEGKLPPAQEAFMRPTKPPEELYDLRSDPDEIRNLAADPAHAEVLEELRGALQQWRQAAGDPGVAEDFRHSGWSSKYPTRSLPEWKSILSEWEDYVLRGAPFPKIPMPPEFISGRPPRESYSPLPLRPAPF